jgi:hypothetical protein
VQAVNEEVAAIAENSKKKQTAIENEQREKRKIIDDVNSWVSSLLNISYRFVEYRFFAKNFPEVDDLVTVEVKKVGVPHAATLLPVQHRCCPPHEMCDVCAGGGPRRLRHAARVR